MVPVQESSARLEGESVDLRAAIAQRERSLSAAEHEVRAAQNEVDHRTADLARLQGRLAAMESGIGGRHHAGVAQGAGNLHATARQIRWCMDPHCCMRHPCQACPDRHLPARPAPAAHPLEASTEQCAAEAEATRQEVARLEADLARAQQAVVDQHAVLGRAGEGLADLQWKCGVLRARQTKLQAE